MRKIVSVLKKPAGILKSLAGKKNGRSNLRSSQRDFDKRLVHSFSRSKLPSWEQLKHIGKLLSFKELWALRISAAVIVLSTIVLSANFYIRHLRVVAESGGSYAEGIVGSPQHVNPLFSSVNDVDGDLTALIFSSLFRFDSEGKLSDDIGHLQSVSPDGLTYEISVRKGVKWHSGEELTANDVLFTFHAIKNKDYESPLRQSFAGVEAELKDDGTIKFVLSEPYAAFKDLLIFGILPASLWQDLDPKNSKFADIPVGSGPFLFKSLVKDKKTGAVKSYTLIRNEEYYGPKPYLDEIVFTFFPAYEEAVRALNENEIDGLNYLPKDQKANVIAQNVFNFHSLAMPQETAIFFNPGRNAALSDKRVRQALAFALPKQDLIDQALGKDNRLVDGPIADDSFAYDPEMKKYGFDKEQAVKLFAEAGWQLAEITEEAFSQAQKDLASKDETVRSKAEVINVMGAGKWLKKGEDFLRIIFSTIDKPENGAVAEYIKNSWGQAGVKVETEFHPIADMQSQIIKSRNFETLLYGITLGSDPDPYVYWHSSQISRGFNLAGFKNEDIDHILEESRATSSIPFRTEKYKTFQNTIAEEVPAIFLYSPNYIYVQNNKLKGFNARKIMAPSDRFANVSEWYVKTGRSLEW